MDLKDSISLIESEWEPEQGFFWMIRQGVFNKTAFDRAFAKLVTVPRLTEQAMMPTRLASVLWYIPLLMYWQIDRVRERAGNQSEYDAAIGRMTAEVERILGIP